MDNRSAGLAGPRSGEEMRCPSCARLLVLRSGPAITPHYAHRARQSCRNRPGRPRSSPIHLQQLTLFELEPLVAAPAADTRAPSAEPGFGGLAGSRTAPPVRRRRRRRRAWLPRLIRWIEAKRR